MRKNVHMLFVMSLLSLALLVGCGNSIKNENTENSSKEGQSSSIEQIKERGVIRVAVVSDMAPFGYVDEKGESQGYDIYLAKRVAKDLLGDENKVEFVLTELQNRVDMLKSNKADIAIANFTITKERQEQVDFANPYMKVSLGVASRKDNLITDIKDLKKESMIVNKGATAETYFTREHPDVKLMKFDQNTEAFEALKDQRAQALGHDNLLLFAWVKENPDFEVGIKEVGKVEYIAPAVKKGNKELLDWLNKELETLGEEKFFHKAYDETIKSYFSSDISADDVVVEGKMEK